MPSAEEFERALRRHVVDAWFPRCLDRAKGGFLCDFDRTWAPCGAQEKLLEFQARQTFTAAEAFEAYPDDAGLRDATLHGFRYLREVMWDHDSGGWFHRVDRSGRPLESHTKHSHGMAYAIEACAAVYRATREPAALELAREGFRWLDQFARDREHGGYFGFLQREGSQIREVSQSPSQADVDTIGTEIGLKDANVHSDLLETFVLLYQLWPDPTLGDRLAESVEIMSERMLVASTGALHIFVTPDWRPVPHLARSAYQCQTAFRLLLAREVVGDHDRLSRLAARMVDHALRFARGPHGGFLYAVPGTPPRYIHGQDLAVPHRTWWVQVEALKALLAVARARPEQPEYLREFEAQWQYVLAHCLDESNGGFWATALEGVPAWQRAFGARFAPGHLTSKGNAWKDASHDGRALLYCWQSLSSASVPPPAS